MKEIGHLISGEEEFENSNTINLYNPNNAELIGKVSLASPKIIDKAILSSVSALNEWKLFSISKRSSILFEYKVLLEKNINRIADIIGEDLGKVKDDAIGEIRRGIENVEYACGIGEILKGEYNKNISTSVDSWSEFEPLGVVLGVTPFNFPTMVPLWMFPLALAAGNSFILKPSEKDPLSTMFIAKLFNETGAPKGLLNIINGNKETVEKLIEDKRISLDELENLISGRNYDIVCTFKNDKIIVWYNKKKLDIDKIYNKIKQNTSFVKKHFIFRFIDYFPKNSSGKVLFKELNYK